jgi:signal transduction histidine kinase
LSRKLIDFIEQERHRIAMELHDQVGQALTSLKLNLEIINDQLSSDDATQHQIVSAKDKASQILKDVKSISYGLKPRMLEALGLVSSLRELFDEIEDDTGLKVKFFHRNIPKGFDHEKELNLYRIVQEAIHNVLKHSRAENIHVNLCKKRNAVSLSVEDDGIGFDQGRVMKISKRNIPLGISIMHERAAQLEGDFTIESQIGKGTQVLVEIPLNTAH